MSAIASPIEFRPEQHIYPLFNLLQLMIYINKNKKKSKNLSLVDDSFGRKVDQPANAYQLDTGLFNADQIAF